MKKRKIREFLREWDEGNFDFTMETMGDLHQGPEDPGRLPPPDWKNQPLRKAEASEVKAFRALYPVLSVLLLVSVIGFLLITVLQLPPFNSADTPANTSEVIERYVAKGLTETGAVNIVAGIILDYRAFDTLGESHVLFTAVVAVMILLLLPEEEKENREEYRILHSDLILKNTARLLVPFILMFGVYIILNGHLGPGGGFSGGAVIGGGLILYAASFDRRRLQKVLNMNTYRLIVLAALSFYSLAKCNSFFCGANGLETIFTTGTPGAIFSAGLILPLNIAVGIVVSCTMYGFYAIFTRGRI